MGNNLPVTSVWRTCYTELGMRPFRCVDLFSGAGGFSAGLQKEGFRTIFAVEIDPDACATFRANHQGVDLFQDNIAKLSTSDLLQRLHVKSEDLELLVGGPPCQGFSTVGSKKVDDPRNQLFQHYFRIVEKLRPKFVIFENVTGFKRLYFGRAFESVCAEFERLDYEVEAHILNAVQYGVPQQRERTIVVGFEKGTRFLWPSPTHAMLDEELLIVPGDLRKVVTLGAALGDLPPISSGEVSDRYFCSPQNDYQRERRQGMVELTEHEGPCHGPKLLEVIGHVPDGGCILDVPQRLRPRGYFNNTYARLWWDRPSTTITRNFGTPSSSRCIHPLCNRGLTTREGARLQSFDDDFRLVGARASKNLQIGNAVPPLLAAALGRAVKASLSASKIVTAVHG
jgi:DNA (cytosine-5)-methyltransferase 1